MAILDNTAHILGMEGFRNLMHYAFPDYQMPAANIFHADIIPNVVHQKASGGGEYRRKQQQQFRSATTGGFNHHRHHDGCLDISPATTEER